MVFALLTMVFEWKVLFFKLAGGREFQCQGERSVVLVAEVEQGTQDGGAVLS